MKPHALHCAQRGAAAVAVALMLACAALIGVAYAGRSLLFEIRTASNQARAAEASEAAEAGLEWALAQLNGRASPPQCLAAATGKPATPQGAACMQREGHWQCVCSASAFAPQAGDSLAFSVSARPDPDTGVLQLAATGCSGGLSPCLPGSGPAQARAHARVLAARLPGLDSPPPAALTVRGQARFAMPGIELHNTSGSGLTLHSGAPLDAAPLRLSTRPGSPASASVLQADAALAALTPAALFANLFRIDPPAWKAQPAVREIDCTSACDAALSEAIGSGSLVWLRGGLALDSPAALGTPQRPVLLVADGPVRLAGGVIHGMVYGTDPSWTDAGDTDIHGAVVLAGDLQSRGRTRIHHDARVLDALHTRTGSWARVAGSWRDFREGGDE